MVLHVQLRGLNFSVSPWVLVRCCFEPVGCWTLDKLVAWLLSVGLLNLGGHWWPKEAEGKGGEESCSGLDWLLQILLMAFTQFLNYGMDWDASSGRALGL